MTSVKFASDTKMGSGATTTTTKRRDTITDIVTCSDELHKESLGNSSGELRFYHGVELTMGALGETRRVYVGDVVAFDCSGDDEDIDYPPRPPPSRNNKSNAKKKKKPGNDDDDDESEHWYPLETPWKVGLILAIWEHWQNDHEPTFKVSVQWLHRDEHLHGEPEFGYKKGLKQKIRPLSRPSIVIESSHVTASLSLGHILPSMVIQLVPEPHTQDIVVHESLLESDYPFVVVKLCCNYRFKDLHLKNAEKTIGWDTLNAITDDQAVRQQALEVLRRGWKTISFPFNSNEALQKQQELFYQNAQEIKAKMDHRRAMETKLQAAVQAEHDKLVAEAIPEPKVVTKPAAKPPSNLKKSKKQSAAKPLKRKNSSNTSSTSTTQYQGKQPATKKRRDSSTATSTKTNKTTGKAVSKATKTSTTKQSSASAEKTTKTTKGKGSTKSSTSKSSAKSSKLSTTKRTPNKKSQAGSRKRIKLDEDSMATSSSGGSQTPGDVSVAATHVSSISKDNEEEEAVPIGEAIDANNQQYYTGIRLPWKTNRWAKSLRKGVPDGQYWQFHVGDIIAVASTECTYPPHAKKSWFPYSLSWCPAMVMAIYYDEAGIDAEASVVTNYVMVVKWLIRWDDLTLAQQKRLDRELGSELASQLQTYPHMVLESPQLNEFPVTAALGKITMIPISKRPAESPGLSDPSMPPTVPLQCRIRQNPGSKSPKYEIAKYWTRYYSPLQSGGYKPWTQAIAKHDDLDGVPCDEYKRFLRQYCRADNSRSKPRLSAASSIASVGTETTKSTTLTGASSISSNLEWDPAKWTLPTAVNGNRWLHDGAAEEGDLEWDPLQRSKSLFRADTDDGEIFYESLQVPLLSYHFDREVAASAEKCFAGRSAPKFHVQIGDVVCVATKELQLLESNGVSSCFPFRGPWKIGQVVTIFDRRQSTTVECDGPCLEIRWFPRVSELPREWQENLTRGILSAYDTKTTVLSRAGCNSEINLHVVESDIVDKDVPASSILFPVNPLAQAVSLLQRRNKLPSDLLINCNILDLFYWKQECSVEALYLPPNLRAKPVVHELLDRIFRRSCRFSRWLKSFSDLRQESRYLQRGLTESKMEEPVDFEPVIQLYPLSTEDSDTFDSSIKIYEKISIEPRWSLFANPLCETSDRQGLLWTVQPGDVVAIRSNVEVFPDEESHFPFAVPWTAAQVVSIYGDPAEESTGNMATCYFEIRKFRFKKAPKKEPQPSIRTVLETIDLVTANPTTSAAFPTALDLLGPVVLFPPTECSNDGFTAVIPEETFVPVASFRYGGGADGPGHNSNSSFDMQAVAVRGIDLATQNTGRKVKDHLIQLYKTKCQKARSTAKSLRSYLPRSMPTLSPISGPGTKPANVSRPVPIKPTFSTNESHSRSVKLHVKPIHTDVSSLRTYYDSIKVEPKYGNFAIFGADARSREIVNKAMWELKLGDVIIAHYKANVRASGSAYFEPGSFDEAVAHRESSAHYPFKVAWGVAEIVCMWTNDDEQEDDLEPHQTVNMEVRWFYRKNEIPGVAVNENAMAGSLDTLEEIVESDHMEDLTIESLLAPATVQSTPDRQKSSQFFMGMPVLDFFCRRFFSIVRRSLVPCGELDGRVARGKSHSKYIRNDAVLRELIGPTNDAIQSPVQVTSSEPQKQLSWTEACTRVIKKLSLTDASKESSESAMIGREKEQEQIRTFLKDAICGQSEDTSSSMFVAGPPGVGKTGCIRAAIAKLQRDQAAGLIPPFRFIALNGMEMRHPTEAYVRLLEALKGRMKVRKSEEEAAATLERYFTTGAKDADHDDEDAVSVVLLDEIDYLVTQKQTVMYNFFDWPRRSAQCSARGVHCRRLVVIGVSNTLNLPERLQPRVQSRIGNRRCYFKSYNVKEIQSILRAKIDQACKSCKVFDDDAIIFAARKTAAVSGDVRKAFQICRSAAELVLGRNAGKENDGGASNQTRHALVKIPDVQKVSREASDSGVSRAIASSTPFEALLLVSLAALSRTTGRESNGFDLEEIMTKMDAVAGGFGDPQYNPPPRFDETLFLLNRLAESQIVLLHTPTNATLSYRSSVVGTGGAWPITSLLLDETNLLLALRGTKHSRLAQKYLSKAGF